MAATADGGGDLLVTVELTEETADGEGMVWPRTEEYDTSTMMADQVNILKDKKQDD